MDMMSSPNYIVWILNGTTAYSTSEVQTACTTLQVSFSLRDLLICQNLFTEYWDDSDVPYEFGDYHYSSDFSTFIYADIPAIGAESDSCSLFCE